MPYNYTVFVHLVAADDNRVAQHDGEPWWEMPLPTNTWLPGEVLQRPAPAGNRTRHPAGVNTGSKSGPIIGKTGERLPVMMDGAPGADLIDLGSVTVE